MFGKSMTKSLDTSNNNNLLEIQWKLDFWSTSILRKILLCDNYSIKEKDTLSINNWLPDVLWQSKYDLKTFLQCADLALKSGAEGRKKQSPSQMKATRHLKLSVSY